VKRRGNEDKATRQGRSEGKKHKGGKKMRKGEEKKKKKGIFFEAMIQTSKIQTRAQRHLRTQHAQLCEHTQLCEKNARGRRWERKFPFIKK
jgi:hypothetical protein